MGISEQVSEVIKKHGIQGASACYLVRSYYLQQLAEKQERDIILYASNWVWSSSRPQQDISILAEDVVGLMTVISELKRKKLDLILHTSGGDPTAAEAILKYLRQKFDHIRVVIPFAAMSAGTVIACGANEIIMGRHSFIGPTDPQILVRHPFGTHMAPAQALIDDFRLAQSMTDDKEHLGGWSPLLEQYPKGLYSQCVDAIELSRELIRNWLVQYMFSEAGSSVVPNSQENESSDDTSLPPQSDVDAQQKANAISDWLSSHAEHKAHGRFISRSEAKEKGLKVIDLEADNDIQDRVLSIFHAAMLQFAQNPNSSKIIENSQGAFFFSPS